MSRLKTISDKLDYIAMGRLNAEQMEYLCEVDQEVNLKDLKIQRLNNVIDELEKWIDENYKYNMNSYRLISAWDLKDKLKKLKEGK